ncbi:glycosyltransferase, partial [Streptomyces sp. H28]|uniref:glycosyltransferase family 2 protein n=1 Tax=Streptomyces sp. H28 TaxID=2775865 RepID=UPI0017868A85
MHPDLSPVPHETVAVVVLGSDDSARVTDAVRSALGQGPAVREVVAVDTHGLGRPAADPRLRVVRHPAGSGGTPRDTGLDAVTAPYVMFLDSGDALPPGAVDALLRAAIGADAQVAGGLCVRRELPSGREIPWQASLYAEPAVLPAPDRNPRLVHDTLCVGKLYRTAFLREHGLRFPEEHAPHEDVVFTARLWAARPRVALIPDRVYVRRVHRSARRLSLSGDWQVRTGAHRAAHETLLDAGQKDLARAARAAFLDHDLRRYVRELPQRDEAHRRAWWTHTRAFLAGYDAADRDRDPVAPGRLIA